MYIVAIDRSEIILAEVAKGHLQSNFSEFRMLTATGDIIWVMLRGAIVQRDEKGRALRAVGVYSNITTFKKPYST